MEWLNKLLSRQDTRPDQLTHKTPHALPIHAPHLELLSKFIHALSPEEIAKPYWSEVLGEPVDTSIQSFREYGFLVDAPAEFKLEHNFRILELKALLKQRGLTTVGNKDALIQRLLDRDSDGMQIATAHVPILVCSPYAIAVINVYDHDKESRKKVAHASAFNALKEDRITDAVHSIIELERTLVFARGIGIDWKDAWASHQIEAQVRSIMECSPAILKGIPDEEFSILRAIAAMQILTGENDTKAWLPAGLNGHPILSSEIAVRMIIFAGSHRMRLEQMRNSGIKEVAIDHLDDDSCEACQSLGETKFVLAAAPELPHPGCTSGLGCRCGYRPILSGDRS